MKFKSNFEVRGITSKETEKGVFNYINLEDNDGDNVRFSVDKSVENLKAFKKGDKVIATIDYNTIYKSMKVTSIEGVK